LPIAIAAVGIVWSIVGTWFVRISDENGNVQKALNIGNWSSLGLTLITVYFLIKWILPTEMTMDFFGEEARIVTSNGVFYSTIIGMVVGGLISAITEYYTGTGTKPVLGVIRQSGTGAATNIIAGLSLGMMSTWMPIILFAGAIMGAYHFAGFYGVAIAAGAMMATTAMQLAIDAFGPIADNAGGIAEMSGLPEEVRGRTDILDSVGNTTAAIGKGFAIASAALTALALFAAYVTFTGIDGINIFKANVLAALFIGAMIPVVFSALAMSSVGKAAMDMVKEVRRQFKEIPGIMEGTGKPEYGKCVEISTKAALREMMLPGLITIVTPILVGIFMGAEPLGAYMAGVTVSGVLWAIFQNNAGGAWDNAKKSFEKGVEIDGQMYFKKSEPHKAAVTGDTVGDPFKDTSGPSMNILIKLTSLVGLTIAPLIATQNHCCHKEETKTETVQTTSPETKNSGQIISLTDGTKMDVPSNGIEANLYNFINNKDAQVNDSTWFDFDRLTFETGKNTLDANSQEQLTNIANILKAFPTVKVKIGGYTDNVGKPEANLKLSSERATTVMNSLVNMGIATDRMDAKGYGQEHPVCPTNDTEECKQKNRRISMRVTEK